MEAKKRQRDHERLNDGLTVFDTLRFTTSQLLRSGTSPPREKILFF